MLKILIVDDEIAIAELFSQYLSKKGGHACTIIQDGNIAFKRIKEEKWDLIVMDLAMPHVSGLDIIHWLDNEKILEQQKILICTASNIFDNEIKNIIKMTGVKDAMKKPVVLSEFLKKIEQMHENN